MNKINTKFQMPESPLKRRTTLAVNIFNENALAEAAAFAAPRNAPRNAALSNLRRNVARAEKRKSDARLTLKEKFEKNKLAKQAPRLQKKRDAIRTKANDREIAQLQKNMTRFTEAGGRARNWLNHYERYGIPPRMPPQAPRPLAAAKKTLTRALKNIRPHKAAKKQLLTIEQQQAQNAQRAKDLVRGGNSNRARRD
jgi:hypothetical protein